MDKQDIAGHQVLCYAAFIMLRKIFVLFLSSLILSSLTSLIDRPLEACGCDTINRGYPIEYLSWNWKVETSQLDIACDTVCFVPGYFNGVF